MLLSADVFGNVTYLQLFFILLEVFDPGPIVVACCQLPISKYSYLVALQVPSNFRFVVEQTLREFFKAIQEGRDAEQSWKKSIYKIISRLDDPVPEYFKSPNFLEQLEWPVSRTEEPVPNGSQWLPCSTIR